jgi:hypothetical protein
MEIRPAANIHKEDDHMTAIRKLTPVWIFLCLLIPGERLWAAPPLTQIQDVLYRADGSTFNGTATISWRSFVAADTTSIPANSVTVPVQQGSLRVRLVPTTNASSGAYYVVRFNTDRKTQFTEFWAVPPSGLPVSSRDVRLPYAPGTGSSPPVGVVNIVDVSGLPEALNERPVKGANYNFSRVAMIDANGELVSVSGVAKDCVRADGTTGPCGAAAAALPIFVDHELPSGTVDGLNAIFQLGQSPSPASSLHLYRNGILQRAGTDFTLNGRGITFLSVSVPQPGDLLEASYRTPPPLEP